MTPIAYFYAIELHDAETNTQSYKTLLLEVLCSSSNDQIHAIKLAYSKRESHTEPLFLKLI